MANSDPSVIARRAWVLVALLAVAAGLAVLAGRTPPRAGATLRFELPERVGNWTGAELRFCQNAVCGRSYRVPDLADPQGPCPACGGTLDAWSLAERAVLPPDTQVLRRQYTNPRGEGLQVSVVISGAEQRSIHRPQQCLPAQGRVIESARPLTVRPASGGERVLTGLTLRRGGAAGPADGGYYAYWFTDGTRETASHLARLGWMSWDRVVGRTARSWAYIGLYTALRPGSNAHLERVRDFLAHWDPSEGPPQ